MNVYAASKHQKRQWIKDGEHVELLCNDSNNWIKIAAIGRRRELEEQDRYDKIDKLKNSMDADLFDVIVLSAKSTEEVYALILENKFLTYFMNHDKMGYRIRAKRQMRLYLEHLNR